MQTTGVTPTMKIPIGAPAWVTEARIQDTIRVWSPIYGKPLTREEAATILREWSELYKAIRDLATKRPVKHGSADRGNHS